ncbi:alpha-beta hydrolase superfamily lysophospholipase [Fluviicoccus keumensis]|uniref:Alpha-beta hydrolase superfamily lysophospholipase n=1 Tax=Fluviicoccus keumensis TaxID=1435465 RepID=A0A4Q7ZAD2_9GAMM|nr:alpha/beta hydrolase [Fluviicoccus keumensis]RZU47520.1 alpha-beta hydrolase superfamily lysophospholipase [Fluviicoccus keumensis]
MARYKTFEFRSRGVRLNARKWWPDKGYPRSVVVCVHSWGDHSGRFTELAEQLTLHGYAVYAFDFEGHGESEGDRARIHDFDDMVADLTIFVGVVHNELRSVPLFLCAYAIGGMVAVDYLTTRHDVDGAIFAACALAEGKAVPPLKRLFAWVVGGLLPWLPVARITFGHQMSRDPVQVRAWEEDPLIWHGKMTAGAAKQMMVGLQKISKKLELVDLPLLVLHGSADPLVDPVSGMALEKRSPSIDKRLINYDGAYHDLFHDSHREQVFADVRAWLDGHAAKGW